MVPTLPAAAVTLVTQIRVLPDHTSACIDWQQRLREVVAHADGFLEQTLIPPAPPVQLDWVIVQRFDTTEAARAWLQSEERQKLVQEVQPLLVGPTDVHLFDQDDPRVSTAPVSVVISTRVKPEQHDAFLQWQRRVAAVQAGFPGFQGYKLEPPLPGVQDDWVIVLRFDSDANLEAWLNSPQRRQLLDESAAFDAGTHMRKVRSGFDSWFLSKGDAAQRPPPAWKQNMLVLLALYPVVFLFGAWVQTPLLLDKGVPFWLALFIGNAVGVALLGWVAVPQVNRLFDWWLNPPQHQHRSRDWAGAALVLLLYGAFLFLFAHFP